MSQTRRTNVRFAAFLAVLCLWQNSSLAQEATSFEMSAIDELGDERYQIGAIIVDRNSSEFTVPGKILHLSDALEYLAVSEGGMKDYESLLALTTSPRDFNLACILIGLDDSKSSKPRYQFDEREADGQLSNLELVVTELATQGIESFLIDLGANGVGFDQLTQPE